MADPLEQQREIVALLNVDPDLAGALDDAERMAAGRRAVAHAFELNGGAWDPTAFKDQDDAETRDGWLGLFVVEGLLVRKVNVGNRSACELFGPGDLFRPWDTDGEYAPVPVSVEWHVLQHTKIAVLDAAFAMRIARWPSITGRIVGRVAQRARYLALIQAVTHLPRVQARLLLLFWLLADRWGKVSRDGIHITLPLTHEVLAMIVGASRPPVTIALKRLSQAGLLTREGRHRWLLTHLAVEQLGEPESLALIDDPPGADTPDLVNDTLASLIEPASRDGAGS